MACCIQVCIFFTTNLEKDCVFCEFFCLNNITVSFYFANILGNKKLGNKNKLLNCGFHFQVMRN